MTKINEKCYIWWCFRRPIGKYIAISVRTGFVHRLIEAPFCQKHKEKVYKMILEQYPSVIIKEENDSRISFKKTA